jgi:Protein of unknown function (DUF1822)
MFTIPELQQIQISEEIKQKAWQKSQSNLSNAVSKSNAFLNYITLHSLLSYFQGQIPTTPLSKGGNFPTQGGFSIFKEDSLYSIWEFVNGTVLEYQGYRLLLLPENSDHSDFYIPQEWVNIPSWNCDYFIFVQVNLDDNLLTVKGYINYADLMRSHHLQDLYHPQERVYLMKQKYLSEDITDLIDDLTNNIPPLTKGELEEDQKLELLSDEMLAKLSDRYLFYPRLEILFDQWKQLLSNDLARKDLYNRRIAHRFNDWIKGDYPVNWFVPVVARRMSISPAENQQKPTELTKIFDFNWQNTVFKIMLIITLTKDDDIIKVRVQVKPYQENEILPLEVEVKLEEFGEADVCYLKENGEELSEVDLDNQIFDSWFNITISLGGESFTESFIND